MWKPTQTSEQSKRSETLSLIRPIAWLSAAVLIRAVQDINGPTRLTKAMALTGLLNGKQADEQNGVWFTDQTRPPRIKVIRSARVGID
jgi:hypothetical protein